MKPTSFFRQFIYPVDEIIKLIPENSNILDIGCGNANILNNLKNINFTSYTGIDPKLKKKSKTRNIELLPGTINNYFQDISKYNCILMIDVMHHIRKNEQIPTLQNILKKMNNNSVLIYKDISNRNYFFSIMNRLHDALYNFENINYLNFKDVLKLINFDKKFSINHYFKRIIWYDHEFIIIKKNN